MRAVWGDDSDHDEALRSLLRHVRRDLAPLKITIAKCGAKLWLTPIG